MCNTKNPGRLSRGFRVPKKQDLRRGLAAVARGVWQRWEPAMRRLLRACTGGRCGRVARAAGVAQRSACVDGTAYAAGLGGTSGPGVGRRLLRACTGGRCGRVARAAVAAERSACVAGTACAAGVGGASGPGAARGCAVLVGATRRLRCVWVGRMDGARFSSRLKPRVNGTTPRPPGA